MSARAFIIHLARSTGREAQVSRIQAACPLAAEVLDAVDGRALSEAERAAVYTRALHKPRYPFDFGPGEIGCFLSHRRAWKEIVDRGLNAGLIIEDDVEIEREVFAKALDLALAHIDRHGVIQFQVRCIRAPGPTIAGSGGVTLSRPEIVPLRTSCILYSVRAAERLLGLTQTFDRPIDGTMQLTWVTGLFPLTVVPSGVIERSGKIGGTTIQQSAMAWTKRLKRELLRPIYRGQIRLYSRRQVKTQPPSGTNERN